MSYKPDEGTLISYMYGELAEQEKEKVESYLAEHPEVRAQVTSMEQARHILGALDDKEVIAPPIFFDGDQKILPIWQSTYFKVITSIAASFLFLMVAAKLLGTEISYSQGELKISLGRKQAIKEQPMAPVQHALSSSDVENMIHSALAKNNESLTADWSETQKKTDDAVRKRLDVHSKKMDDLVKNASLASQDQVRSFVGSLQTENLKLMKDYLQLSASEQKKYVENLLVDFSQYLHEQRNQDLTAFETKLNSMEKNSDQFKQETEEIISSIISTTGLNTNKKKNSY